VVTWPAGKWPHQYPSKASLKIGSRVQIIRQVYDDEAGPRPRQKVKLQIRVIFSDSYYSHTQFGDI